MKGFLLLMTFRDRDDRIENEWDLFYELEEARGYLRQRKLLSDNSSRKLEKFTILKVNVQ